MNALQPVLHTEREYLSSFKTYLQTAAILCDNKAQRIKVADEVFRNKHGFSWIRQFQEAYKKVIKKDIIEINAGTELAERHKINGEVTSKGLNKGVAPEGYMNKGDLIEFLKSNYNCPASLIKNILDIFPNYYRKGTYQNELEVCEQVKIVDVPCYYLEDLLRILDHLCEDAWQKNTSKKKLSVMCHIPKLNKNFKFDVQNFKKLRATGS